MYVHFILSSTLSKFRMESLFDIIFNTIYIEQKKSSRLTLFDIIREIFNQNSSFKM